MAKWAWGTLFHGWFWGACRGCVVQQSMAVGGTMPADLSGRRAASSCHACRPLQQLQVQEKLILLGVSSAGPPKGSSSIPHSSWLCCSSSPFLPVRPRGCEMCQELKGFSLATGWLSSAKHSVGNPEGKSKVRTQEREKQTRLQEEQGKERSCRATDQLAGTCLVPANMGTSHPPQALVLQA